MPTTRSSTPVTAPFLSDRLLAGITAFFASFGVVMAHFQSGADTSTAAMPFIIGSGVLAIAVSALLALRNLTIGMATIASLFIAWTSLGWFGHWHQARFEVLCLFASGVFAAIGFTIAGLKDGLKLAWSILIWGLLGFILISAFAFFGTPALEKFGSRFGAGFGSPNNAATLFGISMLVAAAKLLARFQDAHFNARPRGDRIALLAQYEFGSIALLITASGCLLFTFSRAGIAISLATVFALIAFEMARMYRRGRFHFLKRKRITLGLSLIALALTALAVIGELGSTDQEALLENASGRYATLDIYWQVFLEKPWFGHGLGSFNAINDQITTLENAATLQPLGAMHNVILQWLVQQGIIGVMAMALVFGIIFYPILRALTSPSTKPRNFLRLAIAVTALVFLHGMVDYALEIPSIMWTYSYILGLAAGYASMIQVRRRKSED